MDFVIPVPRCISELSIRTCHFFIKKKDACISEHRINGKYWRPCKLFLLSFQASRRLTHKSCLLSNSFLSWHLVFRSSLRKGHFARMTFHSPKRPCTTFKRVNVVQEANGTRFAPATKMCFFHLLRQTAITAIF